MQQQIDTILVIQRLTITGLLRDAIRLIILCLENRLYYVTVEGNNLLLIDLSHGTIQDSILGPI